MNDVNVELILERISHVMDKCMQLENQIRTLDNEINNLREINSRNLRAGVTFLGSCTLGLIGVVWYYVVNKPSP